MLWLWRAVHIAAGFLALATFWIPLVTRKGGRVHRRVGLVYSWAMLVVVLAALGAVAWRLVYDEDAAGRARAIFLAYIALLTFSSGWFGLRALRTKLRAAPSVDPIDVVPSAALAIAGVAMGAVSLRGGDALGTVFGGLGVALGFNQLRTWRKAPTDPRHWWFQHLSGMITACIGTVTAFLVVNARRAGLETFGLAVWVTPGVLGGSGIAAWSAYYRRKFRSATAEPSAGAAPAP